MTGRSRYAGLTAPSSARTVDGPRLGVAGWPVAHSLSPAMQGAALDAAGLRDWRYQLLPLAPELFGEAVPAMAGAGFRGINVTIPHKPAALAVATSASARARAIGAANTLVFTAGGEIAADNTDAPGLVDALRARVGPLTGRTAMVLGAGGTARAAVWALLDAGASRVAVWNRTPERAAALCEDMGAVSVSAPEQADILVNCTTNGASFERDASQFNKWPIRADELSGYRTVVDFVYRDGGTPLTACAHALGLAVVDGLDLLVRQGATSFAQFTGIEPDVDAMCRALGRGCA